jgi:hypothetical protein
MIVLGHPSFLPLQLLALGYDALQQANPAWAACILDAQQLVTLLASPKRLWMASSKQVQNEMQLSLHVKNTQVVCVLLVPNRIVFLKKNSM